MVAFRRDAMFPAELFIAQDNFYGKSAEIQFKVCGGLFFHTVITSDGWILATGGFGTSYNHELMILASQIMNNGSITQELLENTHPILTNMGLGHFLIKSPDNHVAFEIYFDGTGLNKFFKMKNGEFISVPNDPQYYREGLYSEFNIDPLKAAAEIEGTDLWGVNRRNVIIHDVEKTKNSTLLKIWASYDDGSMLKRKGKGGPDNIRFLDDQIIYGKDLPIIPNITKIGEINLLNPKEPEISKTTVKSND
ncbi:MAG: hypothetical protein F8N15_07110 [Methanobacterium sp.]|nr:hypothetical protein [Methanobacterium sp.]